MVRLAQAIGHVMMGVGNKRNFDTALRTWAETEYYKDKDYAYEMLKTGKMPDTR